MTISSIPRRPRRTRVAVLLALPFLLLPASMKAASINVGGPVVGNPSCAKAPDGNFPGQITCAVRSIDNTPYGIVIDAARNHTEGYQPLGGPDQVENPQGPPMIGDPSCASVFTDLGAATEYVICAMRGQVAARGPDQFPDSGMRGIAFSAGHDFPFTNDTDFAELTIRDRNPSCADTGARATCASVTFGGALVAARFTTQGVEFPYKVYSTYREFGGLLVGNPSCASALGGKNQVVCAAKDISNGMVAIRFTPGSGTSEGYSSGFKNLGEKIVGEPSCANSGGGYVTCAAKNANNALIGIRIDPATGYSSGWQVLGGTFTSNPSCASSNFGNLNRIICAAIAPDSTLQGIRFNPTTGFKSTFVNLGGNYVGDPSCANSGTGVVTCAVRNTNSELVGIEVNPGLL